MTNSCDSDTWTLLADIALEIVEDCWQGLDATDNARKLDTVQARLRRALKDGKIKTKFRKDPDGRYECDNPAAVRGWAHGKYPSYQRVPAENFGSGHSSLPTLELEALGIDTTPMSPERSATMIKENMDLRAEIEELKAVIAKCKLRSAKGRQFGKTGGRPRTR